MGTLGNENPCASSLKFAKVKATKVRLNGVRHLLNVAKNLQGIRCSNFDVLQVRKWKFNIFFIIDRIYAGDMCRNVLQFLGPSNKAESFAKWLWRKLESEVFGLQQLLLNLVKIHELVNTFDGNSNWVGCTSSNATNYQKTFDRWSSGNSKVELCYVFL